MDKEVDFFFEVQDLYYKLREVIPDLVENEESWAPKEMLGEEE